jgi:hypothetical protein
VLFHCRFYVLVIYSVSPRVILLRIPVAPVLQRNCNSEKGHQLRWFGAERTVVRRTRIYPSFVVRDIVRHATFIAACLLLFGLPNDLNNSADLSSPIYHSSPLNIVHFLSLLSALFPWIPVRQHSCSWDMLVPHSKGSAWTKTVHGNLCSNLTAGNFNFSISPKRHFPNFLYIVDV